MDASTKQRRTIWIIVAAIVGVAAAIVITIVALSGGGDAAPATPAGPARTSAESSFLDRVHTAQAPLEDDAALATGRATCRDWDALRQGQAPEAGSSSTSLEGMAKSGQLSTTQVREVELAAVELLCPANLEVYRNH